MLIKALYRSFEAWSLDQLARSNKVHTNPQNLNNSAKIMCKKIAVVTGANKGIGFEIAKKLGASDVKIILACRNEENGMKAESELRALGYDVEYRSLDISDDWSIARFSRDISEDYNHIDILVNNAAIAFKKADPTPFIEQSAATIQPNYFGTYSITESLMPLLRKSPAPRIVNIASQAGHLCILNNNELKDRFLHASSVHEIEALVNEFLAAVMTGSHVKQGWPNSNYGVSKLAVIALTRVLAAREAAHDPKKNFQINACCPGYCSTNMSSHNGPRTAEEGACTPALLALSTVGATGRFFYDGAEIEW